MATVEAPCAPADSGSQPSTCGVKTAKTVAPNDVHILLVDDERLSRVVVGNLLRKCSYKGEQFVQLQILAVWSISRISIFDFFRPCCSLDLFILFLQYVEQSF